MKSFLIFINDTCYASKFLYNGHSQLGNQNSDWKIKTKYLEIFPFSRNLIQNGQETASEWQTVSAYLKSWNHSRVWIILNLIAATLRPQNGQRYMVARRRKVLILTWKILDVCHLIIVLWVYNLMKMPTAMKMAIFLRAIFLVDTSPIVWWLLRSFERMMERTN